MSVIDYLYYFVPLFVFAAIFELIHFLPFARRITEKGVYEKMYSVIMVFLFSFLVFETAFLVELFFESQSLHKLLELIAMSVVLFETVTVLRKSIIELQITAVTNEILERSEKRYRHLIETMNDGFWIIDENRITSRVNKKTSEMLGYSAAEMVGKDVMSFLDKKAQALVKEHLMMRPKGQSSTYEIEFTKKDGSKLPAVISASPLFDEDGGFKGSFAILTDISQRKKMEEEITSYSHNLKAMVEERTKDLSQARDSLVNMLEDLTDSKEKLVKAYDELKDVDRLKTDIISNISHELRTPITVAKSAIELTREEEDQKEIDRYLSMCEKGLTRLNDLVENLVDVSSLYKGRYIVTGIAVDVGATIKEVLRDFEITARERNIEINYKANKKIPKAKGDIKAIKRALANLIDNSIKFNRKGGKIDVEVRRTGEFIQISVKDTGIGIEPQYKEKIFEPFYQVDPSTTRKFGGTGIGLALVKSHIEAQKGRLWFESIPGKGSTFFVKLPIA
jgi:PAS domain S-box-containing protein